MKVAVVFYHLDATGGGVHTFARDVFDAVRRLEGEAGHEFVYYSAGGGPASPGVRSIPAKTPTRWQGRVVSGLRGAHDRAGARRLPFRTWFERSLDEEGVDLVWFAANHAEDCNRPYILTVFDVEHALQPWFPEVSRDGEWERRQHHFARFIPPATRVIVPNAVGRDQIVHLYNAEQDVDTILAGIT